jgi:hydrogenase maturation factor
MPAEVRLAPAIGEDACAIDLPAGALVVATDPITMTGVGVGAHAVVINANDVAVTGAKPRWFLACVLLPMGTRESEVTALFDGMRGELAKFGATLVGGHTEVTPAVEQPVVVGQMLGQCAPERVVRTGGAGPGDGVLQVGPAPVEGAAVMAAEAPERMGSVARDLLKRARGALRDPGISIVDAALRAAELGATALHDPTEGGLSAGLHELAEASGVALQVDADAVLWFEPGLAMCQALGADPWGVLASGTLLAAFPGTAVEEAREILVREGFATRWVARAESGDGVTLSDGSPLARYERDELSRVLGTAS